MPTLKTTDNDTLVIPWILLLGWGLGLPLLVALLGYSAWHSISDHDLLHAIPGALQQQQQKINEIEGIRTQLTDLKKQVDALPKP